MKIFPSPVFVMLFAFGTAMTTLTSLAAPLADRLQRPSRISLLAPKAPLTDIQSLGETQVMVGDSGHILLRYADGSISQASVPVDLLLTSLFFVDAQQGWAVGHDGVILHSADGGQSWDKQLDGNAINALMLAWAEAEVERLEVAAPADPDAENPALDNAYFALDDIKAGAAPGASRPLLDIWFRDSMQGWAVGAYGIILHTQDGGRNWQYVTGLNNPERLHLNAVLGLANGTLLVAGEGGRLHRSLDGGQRWGPATQLGQASLYNLLQLKDGRILAMGFGGVLLSSADQGQHWQTVTLPIRANLYAGEQLADGSLLLTGQGGVVLYSADGLQFKVWQGAGKAPWLGVAQISNNQLALIGSGGFKAVSLTELKEQLK